MILRTGPLALFLLSTAAALPGAAAAHVVFNQSNVEAGALATLELRVTHACSGSPTREVRVHMPQGVIRVTPRALVGWQVAVTRRALPAPVVLHGETIRDTADTLAWSGGPLPEGVYEQFEFRAQMPAGMEGPLYFPVEQICEDGRHDWTEIPATPEGWGRLASPAPFVTLRPAAAPARGHHH